MTAPLILASNTISGEYEVANSLRFNDDSSDYLSQTFSSSGNQRTFTISFWVKRSNLETGYIYTYQDASSEIRSDFAFFNDYIRINFNPTGSAWGSDLIIQDNGNNILFRDVSAWYHIVMAFDTTQSTEANRLKVYVNGNQKTMSGYPSQNFDTGYNTAIEHGIGTYIHATTYDTFFDGYLAEFVVIDGQQLDATSFGEFDSDTNIWKPIDVSGLTFGTNGFYLDFENSGSLGADVSGNGNNFTVNNLTSIDQSTDTCTNNFATLNPLNSASGGTFTLSEGNLRVKGADTIEGYTSSTMGFSQGKWYFECESNFNTQGVIGITFDGDTGQVADDVRSDRYPGNATYSYGYILSSGNKITNSSSSSYGNSLATGDILGVAIDLDNGFLYFSKNGTFQNSGDPTSGSSGTGGIALTGSGSTGFCFVTVGDNNNAGYGQIDFNFGSPFFSISSGNSDGNGYGSFSYSVPSGYFSLNSKNLAEYG